MRVPRRKIHITVLALYDASDLEQLFNKTIKGDNDEININFEWDKFEDFNRRIVLQLKPGVIHDLSKLFMYNCMSRNTG
jgi:hypothetical protein